MSNSVVIKGNKYGIIVLLGAETPFEELKIQVSEKFKESSGFFKKASMGIQFEGRKLNGDEILELVDVIEKNSSLKIVCVMDDDPLVEAKFKEAVEQASRAAGTETVSGSIQETPFVDYAVTQKKSVVESEKLHSAVGFQLRILASFTEVHFEAVRRFKAKQAL